MIGGIWLTTGIRDYGDSALNPFHRSTAPSQNLTRRHEDHEDVVQEASLAGSGWRGLMRCHPLAKPAALAAKRLVSIRRARTPNAASSWSLCLCVNPSSSGDLARPALRSQGQALPAPSQILTQRR